ncbi:MAG: hypothetical protein PHV34_22240 [Verrucomicrobiae bacterium]|nr:hypothetical protein [Verrucomicrobiae bacterium]
MSTRQKLLQREDAGDFQGISPSEMAQQKSPGTWSKGFNHYHTHFRFSKKERISARELLEDLKKLEARFVFCAGDHGDMRGDNFWGMNIREFADYRDECLAVNDSGGMVLVPAPEIHLRFPPFISRQEHHACVPIVHHLPELGQPEFRAIAASNTKDVQGFIREMHQHRVSLPLNHPYLSFNSAFNGPNPLNVSCLYDMDYFEILTIDHPDFFDKDFAVYLKFLENPRTKMACCAGVDGIYPDNRLSREKRLIPSTYLNVEGHLNLSSVLDAWNERRSYAALGNIHFETIRPVPSRNVIKTSRKPSIHFSAVSPDEDMGKWEIHRNGKMIHQQAQVGQRRLEVDFVDDDAAPGENKYTIHVEAGNSHLVTSPIVFEP